MGNDVSSSSGREGNPSAQDQKVSGRPGEVRDAEATGASTGKKSAPDSGRKKTRKKRREAEVRDKLKAENRAWKKNKEIEKRVTEIRKNRPGVCDASGRLTADGKTYLHYFYKATKMINDCDSAGMDYLIRLGRCLEEFRTSKQWKENRHHWLRQFEEDIGLKHSKAHNIMKIWERFKEHLDKLTMYPRRKLLSIARASGLHPTDIDTEELVKRMKSLDRREVDKLSPEQIVLRLKGEEVIGLGLDGKPLPPKVIPVTSGCAIIFSKAHNGFEVKWDFSDEAFQGRVADEVARLVTRLLSLRTQK